MKTVFEKAVRQELIDRVNRVSAQSEVKFGKMRPDQGLHHITTVLQMYLGEVETKYHGNNFKAMLLRWFTFSPIPIPPEKAQTAPPLVAGGSYNIATEQKRFADLIERMAKRVNETEWPISPIFGELTTKQYGELAYKHTDHHLKQFGV